jgi:hypothetical protein
MTRSGFSHCHIFRAFSGRERPSSSCERLTWMVSGCRKKQRSAAAPARAVCSQKMSRQLRNVTIMPPMNGPGQCKQIARHLECVHQPNAGPIRVPDKNHPSAVARSVCVQVSCVDGRSERVPGTRNCDRRPMQSGVVSKDQGGPLLRRCSRYFIILEIV